MNTKKDSVPTIDLHYKRYKRLETMSNILQLASVVSLTTLFYISNGGSEVFLIPTGIVLTSFGLSIWASKERNKSKVSFEN